MELLLCKYCNIAKEDQRFSRVDDRICLSCEMKITSDWAYKEKLELMLYKTGPKYRVRECGRCHIRFESDYGKVICPHCEEL